MNDKYKVASLLQGKDVVVMLNRRMNMRVRENVFTFTFRVFNTNPSTDLLCDLTYAIAGMYDLETTDDNHIEYIVSEEETLYSILRNDLKVTNIIRIREQHFSRVKIDESNSNS